MTFCVSLVLAVITFQYSGAAAAQVVYVDADATGGNNGTGWANAYVDLQSAIRAAEQSPGGVTQIWVAAGTYRPSRRTNSTDPRSATFQVRDGMDLYGGFAGFETELRQRNPAVNATILSGDLAANDGLDVFTRTDNAYHVLTVRQAGATTTVEGFIVAGGTANGTTPHNLGGGMLHLSGSAAVRNCAFVENSSEYGGGLYNCRGSPAVEGCQFYGNSARYGGGLCNELGNLTVGNCVFRGNSSTYGGGVYSFQASPAFTECVFAGNSGGDFGGGVIVLGSGSPSLADCIFNGNWSRYGAAVCNQSFAASLIHCVFRGNLATWGGSVAVIGGVAEPNVAGAEFIVAGDFDVDGDVDTFDWLTFTNCFNGTDSAPAARCNGEFTDIDQDGDVDGTDFLTFSKCFNGPSRPPNCMP